MVSYLCGPLFVSFQEFRSSATSEHFGLPPELIYLTSLVQFVSALALLTKRVEMWAALALTATTVGAMGSHFKIGSPETSVAAIVYSGIQLWFAIKVRRAETSPYNKAMKSDVE